MRLSCWRRRLPCAARLPRRLQRMLGDQAGRAGGKAGRGGGRGRLTKSCVSQPSGINLIKRPRLSSLRKGPGTPGGSGDLKMCFSPELSLSLSLSNSLEFLRAGALPPAHHAQQGRAQIWQFPLAADSVFFSRVTKCVHYIRVFLILVSSRLLSVHGSPSL
jgi:hypothetical protein